MGKIVKEFSCEGRLSRGGYIKRQLIMLPFMFLILIPAIMRILIPHSHNMTVKNPVSDIIEDLPTPALIVLVLIFLAFLFPWSIRRCHDLNKPGWKALLGGKSTTFDLMFTQGTPGPNEYGPDPRNAALNSETDTPENTNHHGSSF